MAQLVIEVKTKDAMKQVEKLEKSVKGLEPKAKKAGKAVSSSFSGAGKKVAKTTKETEKLERSLGGLGKTAGLVAGAFAGISIAYGVGELVKLADQYTNVDSKLKLVTDSSEELARVQAELFKVSQTTGTSFITNANSYGKLALATKDLNISTKEMLGISETVSKSLIVAGASAAEADSFMLQFTQSMGAGVVAGDEFRAMNEANGYFMTNLAKSMGVTRGELKKLSADQKITTDVVRKAIQDMADGVDSDFGRMDKTVARSVNEFKNAFGALVKDSNDASGATSGLAESISEFAQYITDNKEEIVSFFTEVLGLIGSTSEAIFNIGLSLQAWTKVKSGEMSAIDFLGMGPEDLKEYNRSMNSLEGISGRLEKLKKDLAGAEFTGVDLGGMFGVQDTDELRSQIAELEKKRFLIVMEEREKASAAMGEVAGEPAEEATALPAGIPEKDRSMDEAVLEFKKAQLAEKLRLDEQYARDQQSLWEQEVKAYQAKENEQLAIKQEAIKKAAEDQKILSEIRLASMSEESRAVELIATKYRGLAQETKRLYDEGLIGAGEMKIVLANLSAQQDASLAGLGKNAEEMSQFMIQAERSMQAAFSDFFMDLDKGWEGMAMGFAEAIKQMMADALAAKLMEALMGNQSSGGDSGGLLGFVVGALGSMTGGGGVSVNDAIVKPDGSIITTHPDDYLIATKDPSAMAQNIAGATPQDATGSQASSASGTTIVNVVDPAMVDQYMNSSAGTKIIMNAIGNNSGEVKGVLG